MPDNKDDLSDSSHNEATMSRPITNISPPDKFSFKPDEWPRWKLRYERYLAASGLENQNDKTKINSLIYNMGEDAEDIFASFSWDDEADKDKYAKVIEKFELHFIPKRNTIHERCMFFQRKQKPGESADEFITSLYKLSEHTEFKEMRDDLIRDFLILGLQDRELSKKMQLMQDLTLQKAIQTVRTHEMVEKQQGLQNRETSIGDHQGTVDRVYLRPPSGKNYSLSKTSSSLQDWRKPKDQKREKCYRCGSSPHDRLACPARNATCLKCGFVGHFSKSCRTKTEPGQDSRAAKHYDRRASRRIQYAQVDSDLDEDSETSEQHHYVSRARRYSSSDSGDNALYIGRIEKITRRIQCAEAKYDFTCHVGEKHRRFQIDCGADETITPVTYYDSKYKLYKPDCKFEVPGKRPLSVMGMQKLPFSYRGKTSIQKVYLAENQQTALLGKPAIEAFGLIKRVNASAVIHPDGDPPEKRFPNLFKGLGCIPGEYKITLKEGSKPFAITTPRKIPFPLRKTVKEKLMKMVDDGVITPITEPTDWVSPMSIASRKGKIRLCIDLTRLNRNVKREIFPIPPIEESLAKPRGAKIFSKIDANSGFHQCNLAEESKKLTTFLTPFGRFYFNKLPFGITSAPEFFQAQMNRILEGCPNTICHMDDILVWGKTVEEHDQHLNILLAKLQEANLTLNAEKCEFRKKSVKFLGFILSENSIKPDPERVEAILQMTEPTNRTELQSFLGSVNFLSRHIPNRSTALEPLHALLKKDCPFFWGPAQQEAFVETKERLAAAPILAMYDPKRPTIVSSDASSYGIGAVLLQLDDENNPRPVAYASCSLTKAQRGYAQIEKELYAIVWACLKFKPYLIGLNFQIETDHKPLIPILTTKFFDDLSPRIQRLRMHLLQFNFEISHTPGKDLITADLLSRKPTTQRTRLEENLREDLQSSSINALRTIPIRTRLIDRIQKEQEASYIGQALRQYILQGWPKKPADELTEYRKYEPSLSIIDDLIIYGNNRLWIPLTLRSELLSRLHETHLGFEKTYQLAQTGVWWPGMYRDIENVVSSCTHCAEKRPNPKEPLITTPLPMKPWEKVGADILHKNGRDYLVAIDYYSKYIELYELPNLTSTTVIQRLKAIFARHGIPITLFTDNGAQLVSSEMKTFAEKYDFDVVTRSPAYPQANGLAESAVKIAKKILDSDDPNLALLTYRATPTKLHYSPAELLMNRQIRCTIPRIQLENKIPPRREIEYYDEIRRERMERYYNKSARELPELQPGTRVLIEDLRIHGKIIRKREEPRSYDVRLENGRVIRRNRRNLRCPKSYVEEVDDHPVNFSNNPSTTQPDSEARTESSPPKIPTHQRNVELPRTPLIASYGLVSSPYFTRRGREVTQPLRFQAEGPIRDRSGKK